MMGIKRVWPQTLPLQHLLLEGSFAASLQKKKKTKYDLRILYPEKTIIHYMGNEPVFLNVQKFKTFCSHEFILKKLLEEELSTYPRDEWKNNSKGLGKNAESI